MAVFFASQKDAVRSSGIHIRNASADGTDPGTPGSNDWGVRPTVVIDPGHGGNDDGAKGFDLKEKDLALDVALHLERLLQRANFPTMLTRRSDVYVPLPDRVNLANQFDHSLFVSIHFNQSGDTTANGAETHYAVQKLAPDFPWTGVSLLLTPAAFQLNQGKDLAAAIQESVTGKLIVANRGVKGGNLYVISNVRSPAALVEAGFVSSAFDAEQLKNPDYVEHLAEAIADGIYLYETRLGKASGLKLAKVKN